MRFPRTHKNQVQHQDVTVIQCRLLLGLRGNLCELPEWSTSSLICNSVFVQDGSPLIRNGDTSVGRGPVRMADVWLGYDCEFKQCVTSKIKQLTLYLYEHLQSCKISKVWQALIFPQTPPPTPATCAWISTVLPDESHLAINQPRDKG